MVSTPNTPSNSFWSWLAAVFIAKRWSMDRSLRRWCSTMLSVMASPELGGLDIGDETVDSDGEFTYRIIERGRDGGAGRIADRPVDAR